MALTKRNNEQRMVLCTHLQRALSRWEQPIAGVRISVITLNPLDTISSMYNDVACPALHSWAQATLRTPVSGKAPTGCSETWQPGTAVPALLLHLSNTAPPLRQGEGRWQVPRLPTSGPGRRSVTPARPHLSRHRHRLPAQGRTDPLRPAGLTRGRRRRAAGRSPRTAPRPAAGSPGCRCGGPRAPGSCPCAGRRAAPGSCCPAAGLRGGAAAPSGRGGSGAEPPALGTALGSPRAAPRPRSLRAPAARGSRQPEPRPPRRRRGAARSGGSKVCGASAGAAVPGRREGAGGGRAAGSARLPWGFGAPCAPSPPRGTVPAAALCGPGPAALIRAGVMSCWAPRRDRAGLPPVLQGSARGGLTWIPPKAPWEFRSTGGAAGGGSPRLGNGTLAWSYCGLTVQPALRLCPRVSGRGRASVKMDANPVQPENLQF